MKIIIKINRLKLFKNVVKKYQKSQPLVPKLFLKTKTQKYCKIKKGPKKGEYQKSRKKNRTPFFGVASR